MSKYISSLFKGLKAYVPGEQPKTKMIKLNTNESPFPISPLAAKLARQAAGDLHLYPDLSSSSLTQTAAEFFGVQPSNIIFSNGSDEILDFAVRAFCDQNTPAVFADITYGFYPVYCASHGVKYREIPLKEDFTIDANDYKNSQATVFLANPNAQTGIYLELSRIEQIVANNPQNVVVIDEAYIDFGGESAVKLIDKYDNLLVVGTFSKSRSLAGGRLGYAIGNSQLIADLNLVKFSFNPYNVNVMTQAAGLGALVDKEYFSQNCEKIIQNRVYLSQELSKIGFEVLPSKANFVLCKHKTRKGKEIFEALRAKNILVRRFDMPRIDNYLRITIGDREQMIALVAALKEIL